MSPESAHASTTHDLSNALLAWYVNGSLTGDEFNRVHEHLAVCLTCRRDLAEIRELRDAVFVADDPEQTARRSLSSVMARIDAGESDAERLVGAGPVARMRARLRGALTSFGAAPSAVRTVVVLQAALMLGLAAALLSAITRPEPAVYETLTSNAADTVRDQLLLAVVFAVNATQRDVDHAITSVGGRMLHGPSSDGVYTLSFDVPAAKAPAVLKIIVSALEANPSVAQVDAVQRATPLNRDNREPGDLP